MTQNLARQMTCIQQRPGENRYEVMQLSGRPGVWPFPALRGTQAMLHADAHEGGYMHHLLASPSCNCSSCCPQACLKVHHVFANFPACR